MSFWGPVVGFGASQVVGMVWYSPLLFGNRWVKMVHPGKSQEELRSKSGPAFVVSLVAHAALAGVIQHIYVDHWRAENLSECLRAGLALSGVSALSEVCHVMFGDKPWALFAIDHGFNTAVILAMSAGIGYFM